jgi:hypothetical protein
MTLAAQNAFSTRSPLWNRVHGAQIKCASILWNRGSRYQRKCSSDRIDLVSENRRRVPKIAYRAAAFIPSCPCIPENLYLIP